MLDDVTRWASRNGIAGDRIFCNEFGVNRDWPAAWSKAVGEAAGARGATPKDRIAQLTAIVEGFEARSFRWSCFDWCGADFGITTTDGKFELLPGMKSALRLA